MKFYFYGLCGTSEVLDSVNLEDLDFIVALGEQSVLLTTNTEQFHRENLEKELKQWCFSDRFSFENIGLCFFILFSVPFENVSIHL